MRWVRGVLGWLAALAGLVAAAAGLVDTPVGHRWIAARIAEVRTDNGLRFSVARIDGSVWTAATLSDVRMYDPHGLVLVVPEARLDWRPLLWLHHRLEIRSLIVPEARVVKPLRPRETGKHSPLLPDFDIRVGRLAVGRLLLAPGVAGPAREGRVEAAAELAGGRALLRVDALVQGSDRVAVRLDARPDADRFDLDAHVRGAAGGVVSRSLGLPRAIALDVAGRGDWRAWSGAVRASAGSERLLDLSLAARSGSYRLTGTAAPAPLLHGKAKSLLGGTVRVSGAATLADRLLSGELWLRAAALTLDARGGVDLAAPGWRALALKARLIQPRALFPNMAGRNIAIDGTLNGPFATAAFTWRLAAERIAFDDTGFDIVRAGGAGRLSPAPVRVPVRLSAAQVTGVGAVAGGILRGLSADGVLAITSAFITGENIRVRSDKLNATIGLKVDLDSGAFQVAVNGVLGRYLIPGLGIVDVATELHVAPGPGGHGARVLGRGTARMVRLDNGFFRSLAGGLPTLTTDLERTPDGRLLLTNLVLTGPSIRLAGNGLRRQDGTFQFAGGGRQASYGALTLKLDGDIAKPVLDLVFAAPQPTLGLKDVAVHLDPNPAGFAFRAAGGSRLGPFSGNGEVALPSGGQAAIEVARLAVAGTGAAGRVGIADAGFDGALRIAGGGLAGQLLLRPVGTVQRIELHLDAASASLGGEATLRRGHLDAATTLDPAATRVEASVNGAGLRRGALTLARFAATVRLTGGSGEVRAEIAGSRGRAFDIQALAHVAPGRTEIGARGTLDGRPLSLLAPAVLLGEGEGWRLLPARLGFGGGTAEVEARASATGFTAGANLSAMPLAILDIGYPGLGLSGSASGNLSYAASGAAPPTGRVQVTIRGLSRSGLAESSTPIDLGLAGVLAPARLGLRAVMAAGGKTIGRAQMLVSALGTGDLAARLSHAPVVAQLRYAGPADALWPLSGVELFELSGPVAIAADAGGRLDAPQIRGLVQLNGARIESGTTGTVLTNVQGSGRFAGSRLTLDRLSAEAGRGGRVTGAGAFDFSSRGLGLDLKVNADHAALIARDDISATLSGPLTFRSTGVGGVIAGNVTLDRSRYRLGQAAAATAAPKLAVREINAPGEDEAPDDAPATPWRLDLHARAKNSLIVSGLGLSSEWSADLTLGGQPDDPAITGRADLIRGDVAFAGREFQLSRGIIRFTGETPANPALDIAADANATDLNATIRVTGVADKPEISFTSTPALPEDELLSRLLFGTSITSLSAPEALQLASAVAALQNGKGGLDPINAVRRAARLDRLRILPPDAQTGAGTALAAGKYVTRRLYAEIVTDGQGYSATQAEFQVTRWLAILSSVSTLGRTSGNVRVSKDY